MVNKTAPIYDKKELSKTCEIFNAFVCGSDQIWNVTERFEPNYFLAFVDGRKYAKISYAPSFGAQSIPEICKEDVRELLGDFTCLSVRENSGKAIIKELLGVDVPVVLDPVCLLAPDNWRQNNTDNKEKYFLVYMLSYNKNYLRLIEKYTKRFNFKVKIIPTNWKSYCTLICNGNVEYDVGPMDFVALIQNAEAVFSDSFHGTLFSLLFHKRFCTFKRFDDMDVCGQNTRVTNILELVNLGNHVYSEDNSVDTIMNLHDEWDLVDCILNEHRNISLEFLKEAFTDAGTINANTV